MEYYKSSDKLSHVIANDYRLLQVMSRFGISLGFGDKTISEVCHKCNVHNETFLTILNYIKSGAEDKLQNIDNINVGAVLGYLKKTHLYFLDFLFPNIRFHLLNAIDCSVKNEIAFLVLKFYDEFVEEVKTHMEYEETTVFEYVNKLIDGEAITIERNHLLSRNHDKIEGKLKELTNLFMQYYPQKENNEKLNAVIISIYQAEEDLTIHCLVEDNIFTPAVRKLEHNTKKEVMNQDFQDQEKDSAISDMQLSDREKEVVVCVAKGMSNKEIAEYLFLSVNTVTTHRRNIARKLQIHSPAGITIYAIVNKLVSIEEVNI